MKILFCDSIIIWILIGPKVFKVVDQSDLLMSQTKQIWLLVQCWTRSTWEWPEPYNIDQGQFWLISVEDCLWGKTDTHNQHEPLKTKLEVSWESKVDSSWPSSSFPPQSSSNIVINGVALVRVKISNIWFIFLMH